MGGFKWTYEDELEVKRALAEGATAEEIAEEMGRTKIAVQMFLHSRRLGPGRNGRPPDHAKRAQLVHMLRAGMTLQQIADARGVDPNTVLRMVRRLTRLGILKRVGGKTRGCRYRVSEDWEDRECDINKPVRYIILNPYDQKANRCRRDSQPT